MAKSKKTLVFVATYNEIENLPTLVEQVFEHAPNVDILVIDDSSPDGTGPWCDRKAEEDARISCLHRPHKMGLGTATLAGLQHAVDEGYDYAINLDADLSHPPEHIPEMLARMDSADGAAPDVVIGSRYVKGGGIEGWPIGRHVMSRMVNSFARLFLRLKARDCSGSYRCYRVSKLAELDFEEFRSRGYSVLEELLWRLKRVGAHFDEIPIVFVDRRAGASKINKKEAFAAFWLILRLGLIGG
jgi:dolichol-phosphate mannosyltransferase